MTTAIDADPGPPGSAPDWDEIAAASIPEICGHGPATLVDGEIPGLGGSRGIFRLKRVIESTGQPGVIYDLVTDTGPVTAVVVSCNAGGVAWANPIVFFAAGATYVTETWLGSDIVDWASVGVERQSAEGIVGLRLEGDRLLVDVLTLRDGDAACCPSGGVFTVALRIVHGNVEVQGVQRGAARSPSTESSSPEDDSANRGQERASDRHIIFDLLETPPDQYRPEGCTAMPIAKVERSYPEVAGVGPYVIDNEDFSVCEWWDPSTNLVDLRIQLSFESETRCGARAGATATAGGATVSIETEGGTMVWADAISASGRAA